MIPVVRLMRDAKYFLLMIFLGGHSEAVINKEIKSITKIKGHKKFI